ncbi:MAG: YeeE/YedE family protein [Devosia nanyangense]|nr:YeeE/YedE family protein [Devosia nanyangense]
MTEFTPLPALAGGMLIGLSAVLLMAFHGRIAGMTGILAGALRPIADDWGWRAAFLVGAIIAPVLVLAVSGQAVSFTNVVPVPLLIVGGIVVGIGVSFGGGCTSGHGVCGIARLSSRSIVATATFMLAAFATVYVARHILGAF